MLTSLHTPSVSPPIPPTPLGGAGHSATLLAIRFQEQPVATRGGDDDVTLLLARWREGSVEAGEALMARVYDELRLLARSYVRRERHDLTLQPTALVHEAYVRLLPQRALPWENRSHFFGVAAAMMRRVLVDHARRRRAAKRDGLANYPVTISRIAAAGPAVEKVNVIDLHDALTELAELDARQAKIIEMRYFAGLSIEAVAEVMNLSPATVKREWATGRLWLRRRLGDTR